MIVHWLKITILKRSNLYLEQTSAKIYLIFLSDKRDNYRIERRLIILVNYLDNERNIESINRLRDTNRPKIRIVDYIVVYPNLT